MNTIVIQLLYLSALYEISHLKLYRVSVNSLRISDWALFHTVGYLIRGWKKIAFPEL